MIALLWELFWDWFSDLEGDSPTLAVHCDEAAEMLAVEGEALCEEAAVLIDEVGPVFRFFGF